jgi:nucleotide-binding universal stress UspA family protein
VPLTGREGALAALDDAHARARVIGCEVHTALLLPRTPVALDAVLFARLAEEADREAADLVALVRQRAAAAGLPARITLHRLGGLRGRRRERVLDRAVARLARRLDAVPVGWPAP